MSFYLKNEKTGVLRQIIYFNAITPKGETIIYDLIKANKEGKQELVTDFIEKISKKYSDNPIKLRECKIVRVEYA